MKFVTDQCHNRNNNADMAGRCVGVFDTVGSLGLPGEVTRQSGTFKTLLGFHSTELGPHIQRAYHALALNEQRKDFVRIPYCATECCSLRGEGLREVPSDSRGAKEEADLAAGEYSFPY